jgi:2-phosphoglycerate kinase
MIRLGNPRPATAGWFVLVGGWPAAGKSTLARSLAAELELPLLAKDEIKEALMDGLGYPATVPTRWCASYRAGVPRWSARSRWTPVRSRPR